MAIKIDFIFVGPSKTASTWLYKALSEHPDFSLPYSKDIYFFDIFYEKGISWYEKQFKECDNNKIIGEFSHDYVYNETAIRRIHESYPNTKLLICIRNPYERTESGIRFLQRNGYGFGTMEELINKHHELINGSLYYKNIHMILKYFSKDQLLILSYEILKRDPQKFYNQICDSLGVERIIPSVINNNINKNKVARSVKLSFYIKQMALFSRKAGMGRLVGIIKMSPFINQLLYKNDEAKSFSLSIKDRKFLSTYFDPDLTELSKLTGDNYDSWILK